MHRLITASLLLHLSGCTGGAYIFVPVTFAEDVADRFSPDAPGLLVVADLHGDPATAHGLCGQPADTDPIEYQIRYRGCVFLDEPLGEITIRAWVQPVPEADAPGLCVDNPRPDPEVPSSYWLHPDDAGYGDAALPDYAELEPEPEWAQGQADGRLRKRVACDWRAQIDELVVE